MIDDESDMDDDIQNWMGIDQGSVNRNKEFEMMQNSNQKHAKVTNCKIIMARPVNYFNHSTGSVAEPIHQRLIECRLDAVQNETKQPTRGKLKQEGSDYINTGRCVNVIDRAQYENRWNNHQELLISQIVIDIIYIHYNKMFEHRYH